MERREDYIEHWKNSRDFVPFEITPESFFIRMDDLDTFGILRFREPMEAFVYFRYRGLPDMLDESSDSPFLNNQTLREKLEDRGCHCRSTGIELLEMLDGVIGRGTVQPEDIEKMATLFNSTSVYAFHHTCDMRCLIRAFGHVKEFLGNDVFREDFEQAVSMDIVPFIELYLLLRDGEFDPGVEHHLKIASDFMDWSGDVFRQTLGNDG